MTFPQELHGIGHEIQVLFDENTRLTKQLGRYQKEEQALESAFRAIKAESQQVLALDEANDTGSQRGAMVPRNVGESIHREVIFFLENASCDKVRLSEKLRCEKELLAQVKEEASASVAHYQKLTTELMTKLNTLQVRKQLLYDDQCTTEWRNLQQVLDRWTRRTFKSKPTLGRMTTQSLQAKCLSNVPPEEVLRSVQAKRAYIQSIVTTFIFADIFQYQFVLSPSIVAEEVLRNVGEGVRASGE